MDLSGINISDILRIWGFLPAHPSPVRFWHRNALAVSVCHLAEVSVLVFCIATPVVVMLSCMEVTIRRAGLLEVLAPVVDHEHFGCKWRTPACRKVGAADRLLRNDAYQLVKKKQSRDRNVNLNVYRGCIPVSFDNRHRVQ